MSTYVGKAKNKNTGEVVNILCIDDYFAPRVYGFQVGKTGEDPRIEDWKKEFTGKVYTWNEIREEYYF